MSGSILGTGSDYRGGGRSEGEERSRQEERREGGGLRPRVLLRTRTSSVRFRGAPDVTRITGEGVVTTSTDRSETSL